MKRFYIVSNRKKDEDLQVAERLKNALQSCADDVVAEIYSADMSYPIEVGKIPKETEAIVVLGGDGTLIRVAKDTVSNGIPLIGVNLGALGYLAEVESSGIEDAARRLVNENYLIEERMMLAGTMEKNGQVSKEISALNDVVLTRRGDFQVVGYRIYVNGQYLHDYYADGIILSTPTGSTGYNLSAGGSIVEPNAKLIVLTPVCPHTLSTRSIILSSEDRIDIEILPSKGEKEIEVGACFDGGDDGILTTGDRVTVYRSPQVTRIIKLSDVGFLEVLHKKLSV